MSATGLPVLFGIISSLLSFVFLGASDFHFVVKYFFGILLMICVFGGINGLIFLPAILGLFGLDKDTGETRIDSLAVELSGTTSTTPKAAAVVTTTTTTHAVSSSVVEAESKSAD